MKNKIVSICIIGETNSGKSTFINSVVGENISIINKKKNTTLDFIIGVYNYKNIQLIFYDTPGLNKDKSIYLKIKNIKSKFLNIIDFSDITIYFLDVKKRNLILNKEILLNTKRNKKDLYIILNKIDLINKNELLPIIKKLNSEYKIDNIFPISSKFKIGIENLLKKIYSKSYSGEWLFKKNEITNKTDEYISKEVTRNAILNNLNSEIPYKIYVKNNKWKIVSNNEIVIHQSILINKKNYKKIIIGKNGSKIKNIREDSQIELAKIFNKKVHLYLKVLIDK